MMLPGNSPLSMFNENGTVQDLAIGENEVDGINGKGAMESCDPDSGWELWRRVYEDSALRSQLNDRLKDTPTVGELLKCEKLVRAQLLFTNVPRLGVASQKIVRALIESECGRHIAIFDISMRFRTWRIRFFREEDATEVLKVFNGYRFRNRFLSVCCDDITDVKCNDIVEQAQESESDMKSDEPIFGSPKRQHSGKNSTWSYAEKCDFDAFKSNLMDILKAKCPSKTSPGLPIDKVCCILLESALPLVVQSALSVWPIGLFRMCAPQIQLTGGYLNLRCHSAAANADDVAVESRVCSEGWEPMAPSVIHTTYHLTEYVTALLRVFGPQNGDVDLPWRMFTSVLPVGYGWPQDTSDLMQFVVNYSPKFCVFGGTLYLLSAGDHRFSLSQQCESLPN